MEAASIRLPEAHGQGPKATGTVGADGSYLHCRGKPYTLVSLSQHERGIFATMSSGFQSGNVSCKDRQPDLSKQGPQRSSTGKLEGGRRSTHFPVAKLSRSRPFRRERDPAVSAASAAATALRARSRASRPGGATTPRRPRRPRELSTVALSLSLSLFSLSESPFRRGGLAVLAVSAARQSRACSGAEGCPLFPRF